ncbi:MAG TPA: DUF1684 domain-containing protein [Vicinamibacterales bacterium]|nr:DUF1684 domain-containing protein [Vicinamibacterales bacterium]
MGRSGWTVRVAGVLAGVLVAGACSSGPPPPVDERPYEQQIQASRAEKDRIFRTDASVSPIPAEERATFPGLVYFPIDHRYRVPAALHEERSDPPVVINLPTSSTETQPEERVGRLEFTLDGTAYTLTAFASEGDLSRLFVPFNDLTNGHETYGGGRYLNLDRSAIGVYDLDFNRAYQPSCVYNHDYVCPYPPSENRLPIAIDAGERLRP